MEASYANNGDTTPWTRRECLQISIGLFHLCLNLVWALFMSIEAPASEVAQSHIFFLLLEKTRLSAPPPQLPYSPRRSDAESSWLDS